MNNDYSFKSWRFDWLCLDYRIRSILFNGCVIRTLDKKMEKVIDVITVWVVFCFVGSLTLSLIGYIIFANISVLFILEDFFENTMSAVFVSSIIAVSVSAPMIVFILYMAYLSIKQLL